MVSIFPAVDSFVNPVPIQWLTLFVFSIDSVLTQAEWDWGIEEAIGTECGSLKKVANVGALARLSEAGG